MPRQKPLGESKLLRNTVTGAPIVRVIAYASPYTRGTGPLSGLVIGKTIHSHRDVPMKADGVMIGFFSPDRRSLKSGKAQIIKRTTLDKLGVG